MSFILFYKQIITQPSSGVCNDEVFCRLAPLTFAVRSVRRYQFHVLFFQLLIEQVRTIRFIANQTFRGLSVKRLSKVPPTNSDFMRRSGFRVIGDKEISAVLDRKRLC